MMKELEHLTYKERLREMSCSAWRREGSSGKLTNAYKYLIGGHNVREPVPSQRCPVT